MFITKITFRFLLATVVIMSGTVLTAVASPASADDVTSTAYRSNARSGIIIAQVGEDTVRESLPSGTLVLPGRDNATDDKSEKTCMTVCAKWGEDCTYVNRGAGGTTRNCRRTCQQFTEECF